MADDTSQTYRSEPVRLPRILVEYIHMLQALVKGQAADEGLWFEAQTAPEAYLQNALRAIHYAIESVDIIPSGDTLH